MKYKGTIEPTWTESCYVDQEYTERNSSYAHTGFVKTDKHPIPVTGWVCNQNVPEVFWNIAKEFEFEKYVIALNMLKPGNIIPFHKDTYYRFRNNFEIARDTSIHRVIVFLHDPKPGHQLWIEDDICLGKKGSYYGWIDNTSHMAANLGYENRYVLQITGIK